jgi:hypothetical protein
MRIGNKFLLWSFLGICIVFLGLQFVAHHMLANSGDGQNLNAPHHLPPPSVQAPDESSSAGSSPDESSSRISLPSSKEKDSKSSFKNGEQVPAAQQQRHHLIFSTSCHYTQDWQSYLFFYQAMKVNQPGDVTRIVSGCDPDQQEELQKIFDSLIGSMSDRFHIHFTPGLSLA